METEKANPNSSSQVWNETNFAFNQQNIKFCLSVLVARAWTPRCLQKWPQHPQSNLWLKRTSLLKDWKKICTAPEMIPTPKWSPTLKWSPNRPRSDPNPEMIPTFLLVNPENISKELGNGDLTWDCGLLFCSLLKCCNPVISFYSYEASRKRKLHCICRVTVSFQSLSRLVPVDLWPN